MGALQATHYVDDSGVHEGSSWTVVGGPVIDESRIFAFEYEWDRLVRAKHRWVRPIHMREVGRQGGDWVGKGPESRRALFRDLVDLINDAKAYGLTSAVKEEDFTSAFPKGVFGGRLDPAAWAFLFCLNWNHQLGGHYKGLSVISYKVASSSTNGQMLESHQAWAAFEKLHGFARKTAGLSFGDPATSGALQAADMTVWSCRRRLLGKPFSSGLEPLEELTQEGFRQSGHRVSHIQNVATAEQLVSFATPFMSGAPLRKLGRLEIAQAIKRLDVKQ